MNRRKPTSAVSARQRPTHFSRPVGSLSREERDDDRLLAARGPQPVREGDRRQQLVREVAGPCPPDRVVVEEAGRGGRVAREPGLDERGVVERLGATTERRRSAPSPSAGTWRQASRRPCSSSSRTAAAVGSVLDLDPLLPEDELRLRSTAHAGRRASRGRGRRPPAASGARSTSGRPRCSRSRAVPLRRAATSGCRLGDQSRPAMMLSSGPRARRSVRRGSSRAGCHPARCPCGSCRPAMGAWCRSARSAGRRSSRRLAG